MDSNLIENHRTISPQIETHSLIVLTTETNRRIRVLRSLFRAENVFEQQFSQYDTNDRTNRDAGQKDFALFAHVLPRHRVVETAIGPKRFL